MTACCRCRICGGNAQQFLDLGRQPLSNTFRAPDTTDSEYSFTLKVCRCDNCGMVQLVDEVPRDEMFTAHYPFFTSSSTHMTEHFTRTAHRLCEQYCSDVDPFVIEIGANDGTMLSTFAKAGIRHLGVDPAGIPGERAAERGVLMLHDFFEQRTAVTIRAEHGPADLVFAANTLCHIPYLDDVFRGIDTVLSNSGVFIFEDPYIGDIISRTAFDQIYDEHFYFFSATTVDLMAHNWGFELIDIDRFGVHGGEVRYTLARKGRRARKDAVDMHIRHELALGLGAFDVFAAFADRVRDRRDRLVDMLYSLTSSGKSIAGYAATAKSATLLNYCGIGPNLLPVIYDTTPEKQGLLTPGSHIPVAAFPGPDDKLPDVYLLLAWNHAEEIITKEDTFRKSGGRWLHYVPDVMLK